MMQRWRVCLLLMFASLVVVACTTTSEWEISDANLLFEDSFDGSSSGSWRTEADDSGATSIREGALVIEVFAPNTIQFATLKNQAFGNFHLGVDTLFLSNSGTGTLGILVRMVNPEEFYRFEITSDGRFMVERYGGGDWTRYLDDWQKDPFINIGDGEINQLRILAEDSTLSFFVNDGLLYQVDDAAPSQGQIALDAGTFDVPGTRVSFDNLIVTEP